MPIKEVRAGSNRKKEMEVATKNSARKEPAAAVNRAALVQIRALGRDLKDGRLDRRADPAAAGTGREVVEEVNAIVDTLVRPLGLAIEQIATISRGEIPVRVAEGYQGEFAKLNSVVQFWCARRYRAGAA